MIQLRTLLLILAWPCSMVGRAQDMTADAFFNQASHQYIKQDKMQALRTLDQGLRKYPGDPKLLKLAEELIKDEQKKQEQEQQQQQQQQQQNKDQQEQDQQDKQKNGQSDQQEQKDQQQDQQQNQQQQDQQQDQQKQEDRQPRPNDPGQQQDNGNPQGDGIAPQDAMRMLDALERSEKDVQDKVRAKRRPAVRRTIEKDW